MLTQLDPTIFNGLRELIKLDLSNNKLSSLDPKIFNGLRDLEKLSLAKNQLKYLDSNIFKELHSLYVVILDYNRFDNASQSSLKGAFSAITYSSGCTISIRMNSIVNSILDLQSLCGTNPHCHVIKQSGGMHWN